MKKSLIIFRHAKSDWAADYSSDHQRPLANRGIKAATRMGQLFSDSGKLPQLVLCSTAVRARQTLDYASQSGGWNSQIEYTDELYDTDAQSVIQLLQKLTGDIDSVMIIGHEPTWSSLTSSLIGGANIRFPTAAMCRIDFYFTDWRGLGPTTGQLRWLLQPRFFK